MAMTGYNFSERVRRILAMSREEAARLRHEYVGTEHMLLGILREGEGVASTVLANLAVDAEALRQVIESTIRAGAHQQTTGPDLPYTSRAKKALECAMSEARELRHAYVGSEHLLLGLLREEKGIAAQVLVAAGVTLAAARAETLRVLGSGTDDGGSSPAAPRRARVAADAPRGSAPSSVRIELVHEDGWILRRELGTIDDAIRFLGEHR
jgi:ATP-dependent Clp protease ATP-binding subunit ClpC